MSALEIETVLLEHPAIGEVAVVGVPDDVWGQTVGAVIAVRADHERPSDAGFAAWCRERLAPERTPRRVVWVTEIPKNAMGKVAKKQLVATVFASAQGQ